MKCWRILFFLGDQLYDVMDVERKRKPVRLARSWLGSATHCEIKLLK